MKNWVQNHTKIIKIDEEEAALKEFAKDIFVSWDENDDGLMEEDEVIKPLVSLGLAPDSKFARRIF
jgi:Ca2+-binding EF-hand superfamily protein